LHRVIAGMNNGTYSFTHKAGLAQMLKGGVIMDVVDVDDAKVAEDAGAVSVMALERVPADIRRDGGVARMSAVEMLMEIKDAVTIPVMAKCRIGHFVEARMIQSLGLDYIDESEVLTPADPENHVDKHGFKIPFVCGARDLGEALRRIGEGAAMIRTKGEAGTGDIVEAVRHMRKIMSQIRRVTSLTDDEIMAEAKNLQAPYELLKEVHRLGRLPVVNFAAGGVATPADAALMMHLGAEGVFVGSGVFKSEEPAVRAKAIVEAVTHYQNDEMLTQVSRGLGGAMSGIAVEQMEPEELLAKRGW
jgi:pyridoxal 5'-phosphate synthase pdxS subunit